MSQSKKVLSHERGPGGACPECKRRHIHMDNCPTLQRQPVDPDEDVYATPAEVRVAAFQHKHSGGVA